MDKSLLLLYIINIHNMFVYDELFEHMDSDRTTMNYNISKREAEVLFWVAKELTTKEIAAKLFISPHTTVSHRRHLMEKLEVKNTAGLVRRAFEVGILKLEGQSRTIIA